MPEGALPGASEGPSGFSFPRRQPGPASDRIPPMPVPLLDLKAQFRLLEADVRSAVERVLASQQFVLVEEVAALEREMAAYLGKVEAVGVASGTDALLLSLMALEIGEGDEVITTPYTFFATAS